MPLELELIKQWINRAKIDLRSAQALLDLKPPEPVGVCFHSQQIAEKILKAYLISKGVDFNWVHSIDYLLELCERENKEFKLFRKAADLSKYAVRFRYPANEPDPTKKQAEDAFETAKELYEFVIQNLPGQALPSD